MTRKRLFLYLAFAVYQIAAFIFTIMVDGKLDLLGLLKYIPLFKYIALLGLIFILLDFIWYWMERRATRREKEALEKENNILKAKIYDYQEAAKSASTPAKES